MAVVYVSAPYTSDDPEVVEHRMSVVSQYCMYLIKNGHTPISPLNMGVSIAQYTGTDTTFETWSFYCKKLIDTCDAVHLLTLEGWEESAGVTQEYEWARGLIKPFIKVSPDVLKTFPMEEVLKNV